jgi:hypothetical protein
MKTWNGILKHRPTVEHCTKSPPFWLVSDWFNPLNTELNPISHLLSLLGAHHILHVSRIRVKLTSDINMFHLSMQPHKYFILNSTVAYTPYLLMRSEISYFVLDSSAQPSTLTHLSSNANSILANLPLRPQKSGSCWEDGIWQFN